MYINSLKRPCHEDGYKVTIALFSKVQKLKKILYSALTCTLLLNVGIQLIQQKRSQSYSGRHYNTDRSVYKSLQKRQELKLGLLKPQGYL